MKQARVCFHGLLLILALPTLAIAQNSQLPSIEFVSNTFFGRPVYSYQNQTYKGNQILNVIETNRNYIPIAAKTRNLRTTGITLAVVGTATTFFGFGKLLTQPSTNINVSIFTVGTALTVGSSIALTASRWKRQQAIQQFNHDIFSRQLTIDSTEKNLPKYGRIRRFSFEMDALGTYTINEVPVPRKKIMNLMRTDRDAQPYAQLVKKNSTALAVSVGLLLTSALVANQLTRDEFEPLPASRRAPLIAAWTVIVGSTVTAVVTRRAIFRAETNGIRVLNGETIIPYNRTHRRIRPNPLTVSISTGNYGLGLVAKW